MENLTDIIKLITDASGRVQDDRVAVVETVVTTVRGCARDELATIAQRTGISIHTIIKVANGITKNPRYETLEPLVRYFRPDIFGPLPAREPTPTTEQAA